MIISASYKTDIPAFYGDWFINRLRLGHCRMRNPWGGQIYDVPLDPESADGFVFWTRNIGPFLHHLNEVRRLGYPFVVHYTITGYPRELERSVQDAPRMMRLARQVAYEFGPHAVVWRYDPILYSSLTPAGISSRKFRQHRPWHGRCDHRSGDLVHPFLPQDASQSRSCGRPERVHLDR